MDKLGDIPKLKEGPAQGKPSGPPPISPEDAAIVKAHLSTGLGTRLLQTLEPISRRDLHPNNLNISYDPKIGAIDIHVVFVDTNTPLWSNLQRIMWVNRMTWRFDGTGPQLMLIIRWFLPYEFAKVTAVDPGKEVKPDEPPKLEVVPPSPNPEDVELPPSAEEEVGQTKESTLEGPVGKMVEEAIDETIKEMGIEGEEFKEPVPSG